MTNEGGLGLPLSPEVYQKNFCCSLIITRRVWTKLEPDPKLGTIPRDRVGLRGLSFATTTQS